MKTVELNYGGQTTHIEMQLQAPDAYSVGDRAQMKVVISDILVREYADQYGDRNPIHLDENAAKASIFGARIAHGMLSFNFFSTLLGAGFPGPGTIFTGVSEWKFSAPVLIGDELSIQVTVAAERRKGNGSYDLTFDAAALNAKGKPVMSGKLNVIAPKKISN
ncbi:MAG: MaoC family dehydratase [Bdellovibrionales bacterium]|nr:MaoC family dehydratase [Bdellovibrionales bacterium]